MIAAHKQLGTQQLDTQQLDTYVKRTMKANHVPGIALGIMRKGKFLYSQGYGFANLEHRIPVTPETIFQAGSVGKQFTASAIMMLVQDGKLSLNDPISRYFKTPNSWKNITIRHLLSHTSGTGDYADDFDFRKDFSEDELLKIIFKTPLRFKPGEKYAYSNHGYVLLGILVRHCTGMFYGDFLRERLFKPLGMKTARVISEQNIILHRAAGYELRAGEIKNQTWVSPSLCTTADGSLYLSLKDYAKWDAALYGQKVLKRESLEHMWTPVTLNDGSIATADDSPKSGYGLGWQIALKGSRLVWHDGSWQGFQTIILRYLNEQFTVVVLANSANAKPKKIADYAARLFMG
jgi:D-alanyl-D-alanine carboxypeptidase